MLTLFVTASGTELGKTFVTAGLARAFRAAGRDVAVLKPIMSGADPADLPATDAGRLLAAIGRPVTRESVAAIAPWTFPEPISPDMAAALAGTPIDFATLLQFCRKARADAPDILLIEGVGGVMAPITGTRTVLDWAHALGHPALLVAATHLGAISHALTAHLALATRAIPVAGLVLSESADNPVPPAQTADTLARHLPATPVTLVRRGIGADIGLSSLAASLAALPGGG
jgi:dethiobiotin synthetase